MALPRVLHIVDPCMFAPPSVGGACTLRQVADLVQHLPQFSHDALVIGTRRDVQLAGECGLDVAGAFSPPHMLPLGGRKGVARIIATIQQQRGKHAIVHGWSPRAAMMGSVVLPDVPRVCSLHVGRSSGFHARALRILLTQHASQVVAANEAVRSECASADMATGRMKIVHPGIDVDVLAAEQRASIRQRWGVDDEVFVIGALCDPPSAADARIAIRVITSLHLTGRKVRMVMHSDALRLVDARWWAKRLRSDHLLILDDLADQPWRLVAGLDAAWSIAAVEGSAIRPASHLPLLWAMGAALPVVVESAGAATQMVTDQANGLSVPPAAIPIILDRLAHLYDDPAWARQLAEAGRAYVLEHASIGRYASHIADLYGQRR